MKVHKVTLMILDFDQLGIQGVADALENARYANDCIMPSVIDIETAEIGEWQDEHPLNSPLTEAKEFARLFP